MIAIFNEWAKRYSENPEHFCDTILDENGKPVEDYGWDCYHYFTKIADEMDEAGLLPKPLN